ncbi:MAG TPA: SAM-dependent methyltransferase [Sphingomicrobium sp.]|nr:SAM-dependent methyltransferase [Sphingomicrobium sp.]
MTLEDQLKARIAAEGPISVDDFMAAANAHYYGSRDPFGVAGDFVTAPEVHQMFGEMVGAALADAWLRAGSPREAVYAELGPGRGTLANDALRVMRRAGFDGEVRLVETSPTLRQAQAKLLPEAIFHDSSDSLPAAPLLLVANEFFDALPVKQWVGEEERRVAHDGHRFLFTRDGSIRETSGQREAVVEALSRRFSTHGGIALIIDYGHSGGEQGDTLQAVRGHRYADPLDAPGEQDLTAHVDFAALAQAARRGGGVASRAASQGSWLETLGIGARAMALAAKNPGDTEAIAAARRRLCDEGEMGRLFKVMAIRSRGWPEVAGLES